MTIGTVCGYILSKVLYNMGAYYMSFRFPVPFALAYTAVLIAVPLIITLISVKSFSSEAFYIVTKQEQNQFRYAFQNENGEEVSILLEYL